MSLIVFHAWWFTLVRSGFPLHRGHPRSHGQGLVEYALMIAVLAVVGLAGLMILGPKLQSVLANTGTNMPRISATCTPTAGATIC